jgi:uncharacterized DUF497 family protein
MAAARPVRFVWDQDKARQNFAKHGVSFEEASTAFGDPLSFTRYDPDHSVDEDRYLILGATSACRLVVVSYTDRFDTIRIISARMASRPERRTYAGD